MGWRGKRPDLYLGYVNLTKVIFRPVKRLKLIGSLFRERSANYYSVLSERIQQYHNNILHFFELRQSRVDLMTFQTIN